MDDYINNNPALESGENVSQGTGKRRFGWTDYGVTRDNFQVLRAGDALLAEGKTKAWELPRCMVRSPRNIFALEVYDPADDGLDPSNGGDDGFNVYLKDLREDKSVLLYFACLSCAWPTTATWFTDRYVITSGASINSMDEIDETNLIPRFHPLTLHLFDLQTGRSFITGSIAEPVNHGRSNAPTERIAFPTNSPAINVWNWRTLWKAIENGYHAKPEPAPFTAEAVAELAKLPLEPGLQWQDLGVWPRPETWQLAPEKDDPYNAIHGEKPVAGGDPYLTYTETADGQRNYTIAIAGYPENSEFGPRSGEEEPITQLVAHADLITTGKGSLPQLETIQRMGDNKRYLALAGTYQKPGGQDPGKGKWMLLIDLLHHRAWSAHW
jgi:hypothetical protein